MEKNQEKVISLVLTDIEPNTIISEELIYKKVDFFAIMYPLSDIEKKEVIMSLHSKLSVRMDRGACIKEKDHVSWYYAAKKELPTTFWDRYRMFLIKNAGFNADVINSLDSSTDEMMDMLGNPKSQFSFKRRGLVIGDVQSGKTATYVALINKAADSGYKIIILLTGTIEKLRRQTQGRLDEGFIGLDSTAFIRDKDNVLVGVGNIDPSVSGWAVTSTSSDFNTSTASKLNGQLSGISSPVLFVLKKNKSVLEKLEQWLRLYNANHFDKTIHMPMLLIDDEADNASVNTKKEDENPTTINANIRKLLKLFNRVNYVGFTATPFANIFINPDSNEEMLGDYDLFPHDFIYALEAPSNYVGARSVFSNEGKYSYMLKDNDDCEFYIPEKHKKDFIPSDLPLSLKEAIASFFISNAVRDLRGHKVKHRSMLVNVSRFIAVQNHISKAIDGYVRDFQREIKNYYLIGEEALTYTSFSFLKEVFIKHFKNIKEFEYDWGTIQKALHEAVAPIVVRSVNGGNAPKNLNYDECEEGLRLIAVGGYSLSRGLTLEGLCVSYFYRNSKMYDTLMQMGRWFGYRDNYADICQIWMGEETISWYNYISIATDELRREVRRMQAANCTPADFGLCVRSDIRSLLVTARNKMRTAKDYTMTISLNGEVIETPYLHLDKSILKDNLKLTLSWIERIRSEGYNFNNYKELALKNPQILNVPKEYIVEYLNNFKSHYLNMEFRTSDLVNLINNYDDGTVDLWDIVIASGIGTSEFFCDKKINYILRTFAIKEESKALQMSGKGSRLGSTNFSKGGLTKKEVELIEKAEKKLQKQAGEEHAFSQETYFNSGIKRNPLLVIYPVELNPITKDINGEKRIDPKRKVISDNLSSPNIGLSIGIPRIDGRPNKTFQYKINLIKYKELLGIDDDYEEIDETLYEEEGV